MAVRVGSARIDENGRAIGGKAGDQTGKEVAIENWYLHRQGWIVIRAKTAVMREKIAQDMEWACANPNIGYDQGQNTTLWNVVKPLGFDCRKVKTKCETDCARLTRVCVWYAGSKPVDYYTGNEVSALKATGDFEILTSDKYCKSSDYLLRGDILVTKTKGHTVVVLNNGAKVGTTSKPASTTSSTTSSGMLTSTAKENDIRQGQIWLNEWYAARLIKFLGTRLVVDGKFGAKTRAACVCVWKDVANRKYGANLTPSNTNFGESSKKAAYNIKVWKGDKGTMAYIAKLLLVSFGYNAGNMLTNEFDSKAESACKAYQKAKGLTVDGVVGPNTWYRLFN